MRKMRPDEAEKESQEEKEINPDYKVRLTPHLVPLKTTRMKRIPDEVIHFFKSQGFVIVSSIDDKGFPHTSCKGIVRMSGSGRVYLIDLYVNHLPDTEKYLEYALRGLRIDISAYDSTIASINYLHIANAFIQAGFVEQAGHGFLQDT